MRMVKPWTGHSQFCNTCCNNMYLKFGFMVVWSGGAKKTFVKKRELLLMVGFKGQLFDLFHLLVIFNLLCVHHK